MPFESIYEDLPFTYLGAAVSRTKAPIWKQRMFLQGGLDAAPWNQLS